MKYYLAVDIGATSGRHILAHLENGRLVTEEVYRFRTHSTQKHGAWTWECETLVENVIKGMEECGRLGKIPAAMGISTWGADYVLLDKNGEVLGDASDYRDEMALVNLLFESDKIMSPEEYFKRTGIGRMPFDTVYQLMGVQRMYPGVLEKTGTMLMIPSFINYKLTGNICEEYTAAVTTGLLNSETQTWDEDTIHLMGFPREIFTEISAPGKTVGNLCEEVKTRVGYDLKVLLVPSHDTTSAFSAVPSSDPDSVTVSSGTWSILGIVNEKPLTTLETMEAGFTNEGAYPKCYRLSKNIVGMFVFEKLRTELCPDAGYDEIIAVAKDAGEIKSVIDLTNLMYLLAEDMAEAIRKECAETGQQFPKTDGEVFQVFFYSLVTHYRRAVEALEKITGRTFTSFNIIGGGSRNAYINAMAAKELGIPVYAGPPEATVTGNLICQMIANGEIADLEEARKVCRDSYNITCFEGGIRDIEDIPFRSYAARLRREGIKNCEGMVFRSGTRFAFSDMSGAKVLEGTEFAKEYPLFYEILISRPDCNAVIWSSPRFSAKAAREGLAIPPVLDDTAQIVGTSIPACSNDAKRISKILRSKNACLVKEDQSSGVIAVGGTLEQALAATLITEKSVRCYIEGKLIGGAKPLSFPIAFLMHKIYNAGYGKMDARTPVQSENNLSYVPSEEEMVLRGQIIACGKRLRAANLVQGTWGNISVRLDDRYMLVTPSGLDYERLTPYEIVRVEIDTLAYEGTIKPTSEKTIHAALLKSAPEAKCVIHTHSGNCSVFAAAKQPLPILDEEDRKLLGEIAPYAKSAIPGSRKLRDTVDAAMQSTEKGCIMGSHGIIVRGDSIEDAFEKCRAMEHAARLYLDRRQAEQDALDRQNRGSRKTYEGEIDTPVGRVVARLVVDREKNPIEGEFTALNNTTPLSEVVMTDDGFTAKTMFKAGFLKLPVDLTCRFGEGDISGSAMTSMGGLDFNFKECE